MCWVAFAVFATLPVSLASGGDEGESNTDVEFVQKQLTGLYSVTPTIGDTNGGKSMPSFPCCYLSVYDCLPVSFFCSHTTNLLGPHLL